MKKQSSQTVVSINKVLSSAVFVVFYDICSQHLREEEHCCDTGKELSPTTHKIPCWMLQSSD
jgi:hypothetical protein